MTDNDRIPEGFVLARTTDVFDHDNVPAGLLRAHRVAEGTWGRLVVHEGQVRFLFEDTPDEPIALAAGDSVVIPPSRHHHVELDGPTRFAVEFYRPPPHDPGPATGSTTTKPQGGPTNPPSPSDPVPPSL